MLTLLNIVGLLLWFNWRASGIRLAAPGVVSLAATIQRTEVIEPRRWFSFACLIALLFVRAIIPVKDLAGSGVLGPLGSLLNDRERLSFGGTFRVVRPGLSEFQIREIKLRDFKVPSGAIPRPT